MAWAPLVRNGILWGLALGALAPATQAVVMLSGTSADGVTLGEFDLGFFFGFLPLMTALVAVLVSLNHWPLKRLSCYHRELAFALLVVGVAAVAELRLLIQEITDPERRDEWLLVHGPTVIYVLLVYRLVAVAARSLAGLHARHAHWRGSAGLESPPEEVAAAPLPSHTPRYRATAALGLQGLVWGIGIATVSGAMAGTMLFPLLGTIAGAYLGAIYGLVPAAAGSLAVVVAVAWRRETDPAAVHRTVNVALAVVGMVVLASVGPFLRTMPLTWELSEGSYLIRMWLAVAAVVVLLLRRCAPQLAGTYIRLCSP